MNMNIEPMDLFPESAIFTKINPLSQAFAYHANVDEFFPEISTFYPPQVPKISQIPMVTKEYGIECRVSPDFDEISEEGDETLKTPFYHEIYSLMAAFGDKISPFNQLSSLLESVWLMYNLLQNQIYLLMRKCEDAMKLRNAKKISHEDVLFLLRKNKILLKRLLQFLYIQDMNDYLLPGFSEYRGTTVCPVDGKKTHNCIKFLSIIEKNPGDLTHLFNAEKVSDYILEKRLEKRYSMKISGNDDLVNYFESTLRTSFCRINAHLGRTNSPDTFKAWLLDCSETIFDITPLAVSIIEFLAIETVAGLVEKALYLRTRDYKEEINYSYPKLDFTRSKNLFPDSDDDSESDQSKHDDEDELKEEFFPSSLPEIEKFSYIPKKYLRKRITNENDKKNYDAPDPVLSKMAFFPDDNAKPTYSSRDFIKQMGSPPLTIPMKKKFEMEFIEKNPITPHEIKRAFIHYQRPKSMIMNINKEIPISIKKNINLVCLASPLKEYYEET